MIIGILETGRPPETLLSQHGNYPTMIHKLISREPGGLKHVVFKVFATLESQIPQDPQECEGWVITGSGHSVYEQLPWMLELSRFIQRTINSGIPMLGLCFGHQIMADALGGEVVKSEKGWGLGLQKYQLCQLPSWLEETYHETEIVMPAIHQDQVIKAPPSTEVLASSKFCPYAALLYGNTGLSFQSHPEFTEDYLQHLIHVRRSRFPKPVLDNALASFEQLNTHLSTVQIATWISRFFRMSR